MSWRWVIPILLFICLGVVVVFQHRDREEVVVRFGFLEGDLHHLPYFVAVDERVWGGKNLFERVGLKVVLAEGAPYVNGPVLMDRFACGDVDIAYLGSAPAIIKSVNLGVKIRVLALVNVEGSALIVRENVSSLEDLVGGVVATPGPGTIQDFLFRVLIDRGGFSPRDFSIVKISPKDMCVKLESGGIDGFIAWEPFCSEAVVKGVGKALFLSRDIWPEHPCCVVAVREEFLRERPDLVVKFLVAHVIAENWINNALRDEKNYTLLLDIACKYTGRDESVVELALKNIVFKYWIDENVLSALTDYVDCLVNLGIIDENKLLSVASSPREFIEQLIYLDPLREAISLSFSF